jgi:hypothetical protein
MPTPRRPRRAAGAPSLSTNRTGCESASTSPATQTRIMAGGKWPFGRKGNNDDKASGSRSRLSPPTPYERAPPARHRSATPQPAPAPPAPARQAPPRPHDRVYVPVRMARRLYAHNRTESDTKMGRPLGAPPYPFGQAIKYCPRPDPNEPNQTPK